MQSEADMYLVMARRLAAIPTIMQLSTKLCEKYYDNMRENCTLENCN